MEVIDEIKAKARALLENGQVECVIGYGLGSLKVRPAFAYTPAEVERFVWNSNCNQNLVNYLNDKKDRKVAIVAKPCDVRAINVLIHESQVKRENVYIIGMACPGMEWQGQPEARCRHCDQRVPVMYDVLIGQAPNVSVTPDDYADVAALEAMSSEERLAFWAREFDRCIRCYACRQACFGCYCFECVAEQLDPQWVGIAIDLPEKQLFHIMRAYHLAGRCVGCQECERVCPMGLPLSLLNRKIAKEVAELFGGYRAGADAAVAPPLATFRKEDDLE
ncbi:MAG: 4Fe-4S dicluster domain-containing protein [Chloroflexi bacterium]|nr:4Fe-4S dicluster domain-containing protein [Chloroflexota bacterium]